MYRGFSPEPEKLFYNFYFLSSLSFNRLMISSKDFWICACVSLRVFSMYCFPSSVVTRSCVTFITSLTDDMRDCVASENLLSMTFPPVWVTEGSFSATHSPFSKCPFFRSYFSLISSSLTSVFRLCRKHFLRQDSSERLQDLRYCTFLSCYATNLFGEGGIVMIWDEKPEFYEY
jgi:hypothetical protein